MVRSNEIELSFECDSSFIIHAVPTLLTGLAVWAVPLGKVAVADEVIWLSLRKLVSVTAPLQLYAARLTSIELSIKPYTAVQYHHHNINNLKLYTLHFVVGVFVNHQNGSYRNV